MYDLITAIETFKVKKSSRSQKIARQIKRESKREKEENEVRRKEEEEERVQKELEEKTSHVSIDQCLKVFFSGDFYIIPVGVMAYQLKNQISYEASLQLQLQLFEGLALHSTLVILKR
jgi:hypothetical protein